MKATLSFRESAPFGFEIKNISWALFRAQSSRTFSQAAHPPTPYLPATTSIPHLHPYVPGLAKTEFAVLSYAFKHFTYSQQTAA